MATLVLTTVGSIFGGPLGGAIGGLLGGAIDHSLLSAPKTREGPRLTQLAVQTSSYGSQIPRLFGTMRVAGSVIWSTDLIETRATSRAGKGQPSVASYSYSASFAVLLSARAITGVGRIWADGNLLRGAGGDFKTVTGFRLHPGDPDQPVDPLLASAIGADATPAHRGCAYAVFEGFQLASYGNRIPSLTFEVVADAGDVPVGTIAAALAAEVESDAGVPLGGFAASGGSVGAVLDTLATAAGGWIAPRGGGAVLRTATAADGEIADAGVATGADHARRTRTVAAIDRVPRLVTLTYYDPARDYQAGMQQARRPGAGEREQRVEMAAAIDAGAAKTMATAILARAEAERTTRRVAAGLDGLAVAPGQCVTIAGEAGVWRVVDVSVEHYVATLSLRPVGAPAAPQAAASGAAVSAPDEAIGPTLITAFEVPPFDDSVLSVPRLTVAAAGQGRGWRQAALLVSLDDGATWTAAGATALPATMGRLAAVPGVASSTLFDTAGAVEVDLAHADMLLEDANDERLDAGANLALIGDEVIQFGHALPLGAGRWRLTRLLRGRRGTEAAAGRQTVGDRFVLLDPDCLRTIDLPPAAIGAAVRVLATGVGDTDGPAAASTTVGGASVLPPSPVHLAATRSGGGVRLDWVRRSRAGWRWIDGADAPLVEEVERYEVAPAAAAPIESATAGLVAPLPPGAVSVRQRGTHGLSEATTILLP